MIFTLQEWYLKWKRRFQLDEEEYAIYSIFLIVNNWENFEKKWTIDEKVFKKISQANQLYYKLTSKSYLIFKG
jgi:hypothetical protein